MDAGIDTLDAGVDACVRYEQRCDPHVDPSSLRIPTHATFDGERLDFARAELTTSIAFAVFHEVRLVPDGMDCSTPHVRVVAWPPSDSIDPHVLGPRSAHVIVESVDHRAIYRTTGTMDVISYTDEGDFPWRGHLIVDDPRLQLDADLSVPRCTDVSGI
jgi:hypothetical protein